MAKWLVGGMLAVVTVAAWAGVLTHASAPGGDMAQMSPGAWSRLLGTAGFVGAWVVMMAAMMLPSAAPLVLLYRFAGPGGRAANSVPLVAGYLVMWAVFGAMVYAGQQGLLALTGAIPVLVNAGPYAVAAILAIAGVYQFTSLKKACLRECRSPLDFIFHDWRGGGEFDPFGVDTHHGSHLRVSRWG